jgi:hypothetical protein
VPRRGSGRWVYRRQPLSGASASGSFGVAAILSLFGSRVSAQLPRLEEVRGTWRQGQVVDLA